MGGKKTFRQTSLKENLIKRAMLIQAVRSFFMDHHYLEVETPVRIPAPIPECHIDPVLSGDWFLQASPEICMKQLLAAGYDNIFQMARCFRKNERGRKHLPELTLLEWYGAGKTYLDIMDECEALIKHVAQALGTGSTLSCQGHHILLETSWEKLSVKEAFQTYAGKDVFESLEEGSFDEVMGFEIEPLLGLRVPVFLYDYPYEKGSLARRKPGDPAVVERFELYIAGLELCNAFTELTDPAEQRLRFEKELEEKDALGFPLSPMPERFLDALAHMPDAAGIALGIDRLVMLFTDAGEIDEVTAFVPEDLL